MSNYSNLLMKVISYLSSLYTTLTYALVSPTQPNLTHLKAHLFVFQKQMENQTNSSHT